MRSWKALLVAAAVLACVAAVAVARDGKPLYIAVKATSFERPEGPRVGDPFTVDPNVTKALNALVAEGYEPVLVDGALIIAKRR